MRDSPFLFPFLKIAIGFSIAWGIPFFADAQEGDPGSLKRDIPVTITFEEEVDELSEEAKEARKRKKKKNVFFGIKTKKGFTKSGYGDKQTIELFHFLKEPAEPDPYVPDFYWYDFQRKQVRSSGKFDPKRGKVLHGPYKRMIGDQVVEEGIYYKGLKHGRWVKYDRNNILMDKRKYYKGWPKESLARYYDVDRTKLKELTPIQYGEETGTYFYFHENGAIAVRGELENGEKVGRWTEYYPFPGLRRKKKEIQYANDPYDDTFTPFISREWNKRGQLVYERELKLPNQ
jgi:antitoxin component YwqK of YwqJK toxin-antitoxin module